MLNSQLILKMYTLSGSTITYSRQAALNALSARDMAPVTGFLRGSNCNQLLSGSMMAVNNRSNRDSNSDRVTAMVIAMENSPVMQN